MDIEASNVEIIHDIFGDVTDSGSDVSHSEVVEDLWDVSDTEISDSELEKFKVSPPLTDEVKTEEQIQHENVVAERKLNALRSKAGVHRKFLKRKEQQKKARYILLREQRSKKVMPVVPSGFDYDVSQKRLTKETTVRHPKSVRRLIAQKERREKKERYDYARSREALTADRKKKKRERRRLRREAGKLEEKNVSVTTESGVEPGFDIREDSVIQDFADSLFVYLGKYNIDSDLIVKVLTEITSLVQAPTLLTQGDACMRVVVTITDHFQVPVSKFLRISVMALLRLIQSFIDDNTDIRTESGLMHELSATLGACSTIFKVLRDLFISIVTLGVLSDEQKEIVSEIFGAAPKKVQKNSFQMLQDITKSLDEIYAFVSRIREGEGFWDIVHNLQPEVSLRREMLELLALKESLYMGLPVDGRINAKEWAMKLQACLQKFQDLRSKGVIAKRDPALVAVYAQALETFEHYKNAINASERSPPVGVILHGDPGIGKSQLLQWICRVYSDVVKRPYETGQMFDRVVTSQYWEGYDPFVHHYIHYSELGNKSRTMVQTMGDSVIMELTTLIDSLPFTPDMAAVDKKGAIKANPDMVIIDTNNPKLHLPLLVSNPAAVERRFLYIEPVVRSEFRQQGSAALNTIKSLEEGGNILDRYTFKVELKIPLDAKTSKINTFNLESIYELHDFLKAHFTAHIERNQKITEISVDALYAEYFGSQDEKEEQIVTQSGTSDLVDHTVSGAKDLLHVAIKEFINDTASDKNTLMAVALLFYILSGFNPVTTIVLLLILYVWKVKFVGDNIMKKECVAKQLAIHITEDTKNIAREMITPSPQVAGTVAALTACVALYGLLRLWKRKARYPTSESGFHLPSEYNDTLARFEEKLECGPSYERFATRVNKIWNTVIKQAPVYNGDISDFYHLIDQNTREARFVGPIRGTVNSRIGYVVGICDNFAITNAHSVGDCVSSTTLKLAVNRSDDKDSIVWQETKLNSENTIFLTNDICLIAVNCERFRNIIKHIPDRVIDDPYVEVLVQNEVQLSKYYGVVKADDKHLGLIEAQSTLEYVRKNHKAGDCGLPLVARIGNGAQLIGLHFAGKVNSNTAFATLINRRELTDGIDKLRSSLILTQSSAIPILEAKVLQPCMKSAFMFEDLSGIKYFGRTGEKINAKGKSRLVRSAIAKDLDSLFFNCMGSIPEKRFGKPLMQAKTVNGNYLNPYNIALRGMNGSSPGLDMTVLKHVVEELTKRILDNTPEELKPLDMETAINAVSHDAYLRRINASTSAGLGFPGVKDKYIPLVDSDDSFLREPTHELKERLSYILATYLEGNGTNVMFKANLKDEPRSFEKIAQGKTRVFFGSPIDNLIVSRMFLAPFYTMMCEKNVVFGTAVGINSHSGIDALVRRLQDFSPHMVEGDYSAFDQSMPFEIGAAANSVIYHVLSRRGYNSDALMILKGVLSDNLFPCVSILSDIISVAALQPSGKYGTAEDNSLRNDVILMYIYYKLGGQKGTFFQNVHPVTYGDDLLLAIKDEVLSWYNGTTIQRACQQLLGMGFTSPDKSPIVAVSRSIDECSFLKRNFYFREDLNKWVGQLEVSSIYKSLEWRIPSKFESELIQTSQTCCSALYEVFLHLSHEDYDIFRKSLQNLFVKNFPDYETKSLVANFPTWEEIYENMFGE
jgi:hypothetical protein